MLRKVREFLGIEKELELSSFQCKKLLHEFHTFYDINKDGRLQWKDLEMARDYISSKSGWHPESVQSLQCRQLFIELWRNLQDVADKNLDGEVTVDEWLQMWTIINRDKQKSGQPFSKTGNKVRSDCTTVSPRTQQPTTVGQDDQVSLVDADAGPMRVPENQLRQKLPTECECKVRDDYLPRWFDRYVEYKFNLLDRAGDGIIDEEEFEFTLSDGFDISPSDCRTAFRIFTQNGEKRVDFTYFYELARQFYLSNDPSDLGNFINGKLQYE